MNSRTRSWWVVLWLMLAVPTDAPAPDACSLNPCQNGGVCSVPGIVWSCECPAGFLGPDCSLAAGGDEGIVAEFVGTDGGANNGIGFYNYPPGPSGLGQSFTATASGQLQRLSFEIGAFQEAIDENQGLIVDFWNVDDAGVPVGTPLATRILPGVDFTPAQAQVIRTVDFSNEGIVLVAGTQYAFTLSVQNKADTQYSGMYSVLQAYSDPYPGGTMLRFSPLVPMGSIADVDLMRFEVTAQVPMFEDGFESTD